MKLYHGQYRLECMERDLATLLVEKRGLTIRKALSVLYDSETYRLLQKPNTGLFFQSPRKRVRDATLLSIFQFFTFAARI